MPTCLSKASGTLLETTLAILLISIANLVSRVYLARDNKETDFRLCPDQDGYKAGEAVESRKSFVWNGD